MNSCVNCGKPSTHNYCEGSECHIEYAKKNGGRVHCPNGLPIRCIRHDNLMLEHEHGDHPDYKFPVEVEYIADITDGGFKKGHKETHALIYTDGDMAVTLYECCYAFWYLSARSGKLAGGSLWSMKEWILTEESVQKIKKLHADQEDRRSAQTP